MAPTKLASVHPGEILLEEFLVPMGITQYRLAKDISVPPRRINEIVHGERDITADTALRLARYFGTSERFWLNLQARYDLEREKDRLRKARGRRGAEPGRLSRRAGGGLVAGRGARNRSLRPPAGCGWWESTQSGSPPTRSIGSSPVAFRRRHGWGGPPPSLPGGLWGGG